MPEYEIGVVYKRGPRHFIAVSSSTLVSHKDQEVIEVRPTVQYDMVRSITVEGLCDIWGVSLDRFDSLMSSYLGPPDSPKRTRPRGEKRSGDEEDAYWRRHRTGRFRRVDI